MSPLTPSHALLLAGLASALASLAHLACIALGAPAYRWMGAGERVAQAVEAGRWQPHALTLGIAAVLAVWAAYALAAAGRLPALPFMKLALCAISAVLLLRALTFPLLQAHFPGNSATFWWVSSGICLLMGALFAYGTAGRWSAL